MTEHETLVAAPDVDAMVRAARDLCRRAGESGDLPERATLQTLLRFAQGTDSVEEAILFVQYQASRDTFRRSRRFLAELAAVLAKDYASDIGVVRRFLGLVVRAGEVERKRGRGARRPRGGNRG